MRKTAHNANPFIDGQPVEEKKTAKPKKVAPTPQDLRRAEQTRDVDMRAVQTCIMQALCLDSAPDLSIEDERLCFSIMRAAHRRGWQATMHTPYTVPVPEKLWYCGILTGRPGWPSRQDQNPTRGMAICFYLAEKDSPAVEISCPVCGDIWLRKPGQPFSDCPRCIEQKRLDEIAKKAADDRRQEMFAP